MNVPAMEPAVAAALTSPVVLGSTGPIALAALLENAQFTVTGNTKNLGSLRYLGINADKTGTFTGSNTATAVMVAQ